MSVQNLTRTPREKARPSPNTKGTGTGRHNPIMFPRDRTLGAVSQSKHDKILIHLKLLTDPNSPPYHVTAMVDTGADVNLISESIIRNLQLPTTKKPHPMPIFGADGCPLQTPKILEEIHLTFSHQISETETHIDRDCHFDIIRSPIHDIILGLPWLRHHQPLIDWVGSKLTFKSEQCQRHCLSHPSGNPTSTIRPALPTGSQLDQSRSPTSTIRPALPTGSQLDQSRSPTSTIRPALPTGSQLDQSQVSNFNHQASSTHWLPNSRYPRPQTLTTTKRTPPQVCELQRRCKERQA